VPTHAIKVGTRIREDLGEVQGLTNSIHGHGIIKPILVDQDLNLIAGARTLEAATLAGKHMVPIVVRHTRDENERRAIELADNLHQQHLEDPLVVGEFLTAQKEEYERKHPETRRGACGGGRNGKGTRTRSPNGGDPVPVPCFIDKAAVEYGLSTTTLKDLLQLVAHDFPEEAREQIRKARSKDKKKIARRELRAYRKKKRQADQQPSEPAHGEEFARKVDDLERVLALVDARSCEILQMYAEARIAGEPPDPRRLLALLDHHAERIAGIRNVVANPHQGALSA